MGARMEDQTSKVEAYLRRERAYRSSKGIPPSEVIVIDRLLKNTHNLRNAYAQIVDNNNKEPFIWERVVSIILQVAAFFPPSNLNEAREAIRQVDEWTKEIAKKAKELADLLNKRTRLAEKHGVTTPYDFDPLDLIEDAAAHSDCDHLFKTWIKEPLSALRDFDLKYWPNTAAVMESLARMQNHEAKPIHHLTSSALAVRQGKSVKGESALGFVRALDRALLRVSKVELGPANTAEITNCALDLDDSKRINARNVISMRASDRRAGNN